MIDYQPLIFRDATGWNEATALAVMGIGLLYVLQGFRFAKFLLALGNGVCGLVLGVTVGAAFDLPGSVVGLALALALGLVTLSRYRVGVFVASLATFTLLGYYLGTRFTLQTTWLMLSTGVGFIAGMLLPYAAKRTLPMFLTTIQGAALLVVGFVALTSRIAPTLALTFIDWSDRLSLMVPVLMTMVMVLGLSVQTNLRQGDIHTGGSTWIEEADA
jgi:hypothetical protein